MAATRLCGFDEDEDAAADETLGREGPTEVWWGSVCGQALTGVVPSDCLFNTACSERERSACYKNLCVIC